MEIIAVHTDRCTGCKTCELSCAVERGSNSKTLLTAVQETPAPQARLRVEGDDCRPFALQCRHCLNAPCIDACLTGALGRDRDSAMVVIREDRCIGCWTCTLFCPYGVIFPWPERKVAVKCDRCIYMEFPVCVRSCPTQALELVDLADYDQLLRHRRRRVAAEVGDSGHTGLCMLDLS